LLLGSFMNQFEDGRLFGSNYSPDITEADLEDMLGEVFDSQKK
jgi:hypothetical protein